MKDPLGVGPSKGNHIDPHSQKEHTEIHKIPKFVVNQDSCAEIQRFKNVKINKEMYGHLLAGSDSVQMAIHFFVNFGIFKWLYLAYSWVYLHQPWGFCKGWSSLMTMDQ